MVVISYHTRRPYPSYQRRGLTGSQNGFPCATGNSIRRAEWYNQKLGVEVLARVRGANFANSIQSLEK